MRFTRDHEYARLEDGLVVIGISRHAQRQHGDVVFVELPALGAKLALGDPAAMVESMNSASEVYCPLAGQVVAINAAIVKEPSLINDDAQGRGWLFKLKPTDIRDLDALMDEDAYSQFIQTIA